MEINRPLFSFAFQPIVDIENCKIVSYEALVRGSNNQSAETILSKLYEQDIYAFDELLRKEAILLANKLGVSSSLNLNMLVGTLEVSDTAITSSLDTAEEIGFSIEKLTFEITEKEVIIDMEKFIDQVNLYRGMGANIAIDDFGAGYSGLNIIAEFQPDSVKIDMSLIRNINSRGPRQAIVRGVTRACLDLGIDIIAEGIETHEEFSWCYHEGISLFQGNYFASPSFEHLPVVNYPEL